MSAKRPRLFATTPAPQGAVLEAERPTPTAPPPERPDRPDRAGKRLIGGYFDMPVSQQLRILAAERNTTIQELLRESLNDLFQKYGKSRIA
jgi:antitoxin-like ribbon-helix-helix protein